MMQINCTTFWYAVSLLKCGKQYNNLKKKYQTFQHSKVKKAKKKKLVTLIFNFVQMGLKYGCPVEDVITGLSIQCKGWKSVYYNPEREGFLGVSPTTLDQTLVQHKRWSEGDFLILLSKYSPVLYGLGRIDPLLQMGYCIYCLWAPSCFPTLYYSIIPSLHLLTGVSLFPQVYFLISPFFYLHHSYTLACCNVPV